jgi:cholesterol transport system auxiliary component
MMRALVLSWLAAVAVSGCALTDKSEPMTPRYFSPERPGDAARAAAKPPEPALELRLGRIDGSPHLEERLVYRASDNELGYYAERRWTEAPEEYLKRRLVRVLFEERGVRHVVGGSAATLDVKLTAFEEVRAPTRKARVQLTVTLHDQHVVLWEETVTVERAVGGPGTTSDLPDAVVTALGDALGAAVDRVADRVVRELGTPTVPAPATAAAISGK